MFHSINDIWDLLRPIRQRVNEIPDGPWHNRWIQCVYDSFDSVKELITSLKDQAATKEHLDVIETHTGELKKAVSELREIVVVRDIPLSTRSRASDLVAEETSRMLKCLPTQPQLPEPSQLPLDSIFGQLHALHQNLLQWTVHMDTQIIKANDMLNKVLTQANFDRAHKETHSELATLLADVAKLNSTSEDYLATLKSVKERLLSLQGTAPDIQLNAVLEHITALLKACKQEPEHEGGIQEDQQTNDSLPALQPQHPNLKCRTYGTLIFDDQFQRHSMDILGSAPSSTLELSVNTVLKPSSTEVTFDLTDRGRVLIHKQTSTPHKLMNMPEDALYLLHNLCPRFTYRRESVC